MGRKAIPARRGEFPGEICAPGAGTEVSGEWEAVCALAASCSDMAVDTCRGFLRPPPSLPDQRVKELGLE